MTDGISLRAGDTLVRQEEWNMETGEVTVLSECVVRQEDVPVGYDPYGGWLSLGLKGDQWMPPERIGRALDRMLKAAVSVPVRSPATHGPDKTPETGVCPNCRRAARHDLKALHGITWSRAPLLIVCWFAASGMVAGEHTCDLEVCGCSGPHKER